MKIPKSIQAGRFFKAVFGNDGFPAFVFKETVRDFLYLHFKITNILLERRVRILKRLVFDLKSNLVVPPSHVIEEALGNQCCDHPSNDRRSVDRRIDGQERECRIAVKVIERLGTRLLANDKDQPPRERR